jgi:hypothetical protein
MKTSKFLNPICILALLFGAMLTITSPAQAASGPKAEWAGQTGGSDEDISYESYGWITSNRDRVYPYYYDTAYTIMQDSYMKAFTSGTDLNSCTLYYAENSVSWPSSWTSVSGSISAVGSSNNDRCTFTFSPPNDSTEYMFYIVYVYGSYTWYGFPGAGSTSPSFTVAPSTQNQTYKLSRNPSATYHNVRIDGRLGEWGSSQSIGSDGGSANFYVTWNSSAIFVRISGGFGDTDRLNIGIDTNPGSNDLSGSNVTNGFAKAQFAGYLVPDYIIQSTGTTNLDKYTRSGSSWGSPSSIYASGANLYRSSSTAEIRIPRSEIDNPSGAVALYFWLANSSDNMYTCYGIDKPGCNTSSNVRLRSALVFDSLGSGITPSTAYKTDYNASETRTLGSETVSGIRHFYASNGTTTMYGGNTAINGNLTIASDGTLSLDPGYTWSVAGNVINNGSLTNWGNLSLNGSGAQSISGSGNIFQLNKLTTEGSGTKTLSRSLTSVEVDIKANTTLSVGSNTLTLDGSKGETTAVNPIFRNNGSFDAGTGLVEFKGTNNINGKVLGANNTTFYNVLLTRTGSAPAVFGVDFRDQKPGSESRAIISNQLELTAGTFVADEEDCGEVCGGTLDGTPRYTTGSTLKYNVNGTFNSAAEWKVLGTSCGITAGLPHHVVIAKDTTLNLTAAYDTPGNPTGEYAANPNKYLCGNLTIENSGSLESTGGTLSLAGNWTNNGSFTHNNGTITFTNTNTEQQILGNSSTAFNILNNRTTVGNLVLNDLSTNGASAQTFNNYNIYRRNWTPVTGQSHSFGLARLTIAIDSVSGSSPSIQVDRIDQDSSHKTGSWPTWGVGNGIYWDITSTNITSVQADLSAPTTAGPGTGLVSGTANGATFTEDANSKLCKYTGGGGGGWDCRNNETALNDTVGFNDATGFSEWALGRSVGPTSIKLLNLSAQSDLERPWALPALIGLSLMILLGLSLLRRRH